MQDSWLNDIQTWIDKYASELENAKDFSELSFKILSENDRSKDFDIHSFTGQFFNQKSIPNQFKVNSYFGDPPFTIYESRNKKFIAEIYFWNKAHTAIHDHSFSGAFKLLKGTSLAADYKFENSKELTNKCYRGELNLSKLEILKPSHTQLIKPGKEFIHRVLHLEPNTVSLVLRTVIDKEYTQMNYFMNQLSCPALIDSKTQLKLRTLKWMLKNNISPKQDFISDLVYYQDFWDIFSSFPNYNDQFKKLFKLTFSQSKIPPIDNSYLLEKVLEEVDDLQLKLLIASYEALDKLLWNEWIEKNLSINADEALKSIKEFVNRSKVLKSESVNKIHFLSHLV